MRANVMEKLLVLMERAIKEGDMDTLMNLRTKSIILRERTNDASVVRELANMRIDG